MALTKKQKNLLFTNLTRAMTLDRMMMRIIRAGRMTGFYHEGGISLAPGVAIGSFLRKEDSLIPHYRAHGIAEMLSKGVDIPSYVAEHMGRETGCCKGRSSYHWSYPEDNMYGSGANLGMPYGLNCGYAFAAAYKGTDLVSLCAFGDGAFQEGRAYEGLSMASAWKLPAIFWCNNNGIAQHTELSNVYPIEDLSRVAAALDIPTMIVDGQDLFACGEAALKSIAHARAGNGPFFVEAKYLRAQEHNVGGLNTSGDAPRSQQLMDEWKEQRDPLKLATQQLLDDGILTHEEIEKIQNDAEAEADEIEAFAEQSPKALPSIEEQLAAVYAPDTAVENK
ncbi:MAG: thiamine pyrophosphate-dependent dehydrogenase E1 component subunit alpha [Gammaproteobacteria bacterium]|nr:MAG: thiamine pyrophosphate-dependent dehydrogenase E1 component subunit alpha [Gammaproteobacteria bacterium]